MRRYLSLLVLLTVILLTMSSFSFAMSALTNADMDGISGQAGITVTSCGLQYIRVQLGSLAWGDPDGIDSTTSAGYLCIDGNRDVNIGAIVNGERTTTVDVGTVNASCTVDCVTIPDNTTFLRVSSTWDIIDINTDIGGIGPFLGPTEFTLALSDSPGGPFTSDEILGTFAIKLTDIDISSNGLFYIFAH